MIDVDVATPATSDNQPMIVRPALPTGPPTGTARDADDAKTRAPPTPMPVKSMLILLAIVAAIALLAIVLVVCVVRRHRKTRAKRAAAQSPNSAQHFLHGEQEQPMLRPKQ